MRAIAPSSASTRPSRWTRWQDGVGARRRRVRRLLADYCLDVAEREQVLVRSTTLAAPLLLELQREILAREALAAAARRGARARRRASTRTRATSSSTTPAARADRGQEGRQGPEHPGDRRPARAGGHRPRADRPRRARAQADPRGDDEEALVHDAVADAGARRAGRDGVDEFGAFVERALFLDQPDPARSWGELRAFQDELIGRLVAGARAAPRGRGHRPDAQRQGPHVGQLRRQAQHAVAARSSPGRSRRAPSGPIRFDVRELAAGVDVDGVELTFRDGEVVEAHAPTRRGATCSAALATDDGARAPRRDRHRHELRHRPPDRHDPVRREDRRHRPPRARPLLSGDRRARTRPRCTGT